MHTLKLTQIGNSVGVILPRELLVKLGMAKGDTIYAMTSPTASASPSPTPTSPRRWRSPAAS
jgi:antitoxin component of MazEF toxin-antitoxin module